jgi:Domain of unknown function (DUF4160)
MPTVLWINGLRVVIYPNDHRPSHVHVIGRGHEAVFVLNCPDGPVEIRENYGFAKRELKQIARALMGQLAEICRVWEEFHGTA